MKKKLLAVLLAAVTALTISGCGTNNNDSSKASSQKITFVLDWTPNTNHTGLYVAKEKGYFSEAGIDVEIVQAPENGAEVLVGSKKAQFGISFQDTLASSFDKADQIPITAVAAVIQHNTSGIIARKGEGLDHPKGLMGKKYATWGQPIEQAMIKDVVEQDGGDFSKVELIPEYIDDEASALKAKSIDAIWVYYAWGGIATEVAGLDTDYFAFKDINPAFDYYTPVIIANNEYLTENPKQTKAFLSALKKGYEDAIEDPEGAADILLKAAPELSKDQVVASQKWLADQYQADAKQWGYIDPKRWNAFYNWLNENKLVENPLPENTGFTNEYIE